MRIAFSLLQVSVKFRVANNTALQGLDYEVLTDTVTLPEGVVSRPLPIRLIDDLIPEQEEVFYVELQNQITGGAVLGTSSVAVVTILPSDDPNGLFGIQRYSLLLFFEQVYRDMDYQSWEFNYSVAFTWLQYINTRLILNQIKT